MKTTGVGGERGYDGGKKVKGRKRHLLVDTQGLVLKAKVQPANVMDRDGIKPLLKRVREHFRQLSHLWLGTPDTTARTKARTGQKRRWA